MGCWPRALTNLVGVNVATIVVAIWTGDLNTTRMQLQLDNETLAVAEEPETVLGQVETHIRTIQEEKSVHRKLSTNSTGG